MHGLEKQGLFLFTMGVPAQGEMVRALARFPTQSCDSLGTSHLLLGGEGSKRERGGDRSSPTECKRGTLEN